MGEPQHGSVNWQPSALRRLGEPEPSALTGPSPASRPAPPRANSSTLRAGSKSYQKQVIRSCTSGTCVVCMGRLTWGSYFCKGTDRRTTLCEPLLFSGVFGPRSNRTRVYCPPKCLGSDVLPHEPGRTWILIWVSAPNGESDLLPAEWNRFWVSSRRKGRGTSQDGGSCWVIWHTSMLWRGNALYLFLACVGILYAGATHTRNSNLVHNIMDIVYDDIMDIPGHLAPECCTFCSPVILTLFTAPPCGPKPLSFGRQTHARLQSLHM
jgi:hypothetical protein